MSRRLSFLRHFLRSPRRATAASPVEIAFDRWLDARRPEFGSGSGIDVTPLSVADRAEVAALSATFHQIDRLDARTTAGGSDARLQTRCWEEIMHATIPATATISPEFSPSSLTASPPNRPKRPEVPRLRDQPSRIGGFARLSPVLNVAIVALLVVVLGLSTWTVIGTRWDRTSDPGGTEGPTSLAAIDPNGTPTGSTEQGILPTAGECMAQPLTVDEVMERLRPWLKEYEGGGYTFAPWVPQAVFPSPVAGKIDFDKATIVAPITTATPVSATPVDLALSDIAVVQREVMACFLAQDPFRIWALTAPNATYWNFLAWTLMQRMDEQDVRAAIEDLEGKTGAERMTMFTMQGYGIVNRMPFVNPDLAASAYGMDGTTPVMRVSTLAYDVNHPDRLPIVQPIDQTYQTWLYVYDEASHRWLVDNIGDFGPLS